MTRTPGRHGRTATPTPTRTGTARTGTARTGPAGRPVAILSALVLITVGALWLAGRTPPPTLARAGSAPVEAEERQLVCPSARGSGAAARVVDLVGRLASGTADPAGGGTGQVSADGQPVDVAPGAVVARSASTSQDAAPVVVEASGGATRDTFATRAVDGGGVARCAAPRASWWFAGAGGSSAHYSTLWLTNPRPGPAVVEVTVWGADGEVPGAGLRGIAVRPGETVGLDLARRAPSPGNLAVHVDASRGLVAASVEDHTRDLLAPRAEPGTEYVPASAGPTRRFTVTGLAPPAGPARPGGEQLPAAIRDSVGLVLANPGQQPAVAQVRVSNADGLSQPAALAAPVSVPPASAVTVPVRSLVVGAGRTALTVTSDRPVLGGFLAPGSDLLHGVDTLPWEGPAAVALPEAGTATLVLSARSAPATVSVTTYDADGDRVRTRSVSVAARSTVVRELSTRAASVVVTASGGVTGSVLVQRPGAGLSALPLSPLQEALQAPVVRPGG